MSTASRALPAGLLAAAALLPLAGCMGDTRPKVVIEWGAHPEELEGREVEIDGRVAGKLSRFGAATRTAFLVDQGSHRVRIVHPRLDCAPAEVQADLQLQRIMLLVEVGEMIGSSGRPQLVLRR